jgi:hypothetical protein
MYAENELLFPPYAISKLTQSRGQDWQKLVQRVLRREENHPERLAFSLMMVRLDGCLGCETDSYRAMKGCISCALQTLRRFKGSDADLLDRYDQALNDLTAYLETLPQDRLALPLVPARAA